MRCFLVFILLLNTSIHEGCARPISVDFKTIAGVLPFDYSMLQTSFFLQLRAIDAFYYIRNEAALVHLSILYQGIQEQCPPHEGRRCMSYFFIQNPTHTIKTLNETPEPALLTSYRAPIYEMVFSLERWPVPRVNLNCENYDSLLGNKLKICAGTQNMGNQRSVAFGMYLKSYYN